MIRVLLLYLFLSIAFGFAITVFRQATGQERLTWLKTVGFAVGCSMLAVVTLSLIVIIF
jgi:hypothetical protein